MSVHSAEIVFVYFLRDTEKILVGKLAVRNRRIAFEYSTEFLKTGVELSPFKLPLKPGIHINSDAIFDGLFGVFNDSLPDGWGRLLLDRKLVSLGMNPGKLSPLDRLCYVGNHGTGALLYEPEVYSPESFQYEDLDQVAKEIQLVEEEDNDQSIDHLLSLNGSSAGARPKITTTFRGEDWFIKFRSSIDPKDIGLIEYAYHLMAKEAGLDVPEAKLFPSKRGGGYFGTKRFDRLKEKRFHMHTVSGLLHADYRLPSLDYEIIMKATLWLTKDTRECEKLFRMAVFNVLSHNRDDHGKNFSFLLKKRWCVSPAYDLTFSSGPSGEHASMIMHEGKNPKLSHLLKLAAVGDIKKENALEIVHDVEKSVAKWKVFSKEAGVSSASSQMIQETIRQISTNFKDI